MEQRECQERSNRPRTISFTRAASSEAHAGTLETRQVMGDLILEVGERALKKICLDVADEAYQRVITTFSGFGYVAHQQRAQIGIDDDVREARRGR